MIVRLEAELFDRCLLLVTFCSLLFTFWSLLVTFCSLLVTFFSLLVTFSSLRVTFCSLLVIFSSKLLWNKIIVNRKKMVWLPRNSATDIFYAIFCDFGNFFWMMVCKIFSTCKTIFKFDIKSQILPAWIDITSMSL